MNNPGGRSIAWIDGPGEAGTWGAPEQLALPLADRGLALADGIFETILIQNAKPQLLEAHLQRWSESAARLGMDAPPDADRLRPLLAAAIERSGSADAALRLNWSRGNAGRGIALPADDAPPSHRFWLQLSPWRPSFEAVSTLISQGERRNPASQISACKTFAYGWAVQARREAHQGGADDALLLNTAGQLCCATTANLLLLIEGCWLTPPLGSGCLPGIMRAQGLAQGWLQEADLWPVDLDRSEAGLLINSLDCRPLQGKRPNALTTESLGPTARTLWQRCLQGAQQKRTIQDSSRK
jgi:branched-subunit amino acid aminotransferase/4-amino-4-deoxychorismate lyase